MRIAVIVCHGMGEQVPFETLNAVAEALWAAQSPVPLDASRARVRYVAFGDDWLPRVELTLHAHDGGERRVHLYEVYWAPLTEGKVTARDAIGFLLGAGVRGMRYCARGAFDRSMFGERVVFRLPRRGVLQLGAALSALFALLAGFAWVVAATVAELLRVFLPGIAPRSPGWIPALPDVWMAGLLVGALVIFAALRWFLVQSVGDVAAYISAHRASRFAEIRRAIQDAARRVARNVYAARDGDGGAPQYEHVLIVGHSLGSLIAYDMLDDSINRDLAAADGAGTFLGVVRRTKLLLTLGSPLDKTAFLFRTQKDHAPLREALAAAAQPMIVSVANRPARWINIWSPFDWISGALQYYDAPREDAPGESNTSAVDVSPGGKRPDTSAADASLAGKRPGTSTIDISGHSAAGGGAAATASRPPDRGSVENVRERGVPFDPVRSHLGYWKRTELATRLFEALRDCGAVSPSAEEARLPSSFTAGRGAETSP